MKSTNPWTARQGDVLITRVENLPEGLTEHPRGGRIVLAEGEATGHAHAIYDQGAVDLTVPAPNPTADAVDHIDGNVVYLRVDRTVALRHEEHAPIEIPPGIYRVGGQREYTPEEIRRVID